MPLLHNQFIRILMIPDFVTHSFGSQLDVQNAISLSAFPEQRFSSFTGINENFKSRNSSKNIIESSSFLNNMMDPNSIVKIKPNHIKTIDDWKMLAGSYTKLESIVL